MFRDAVIIISLAVADIHIIGCCNKMCTFAYYYTSLEDDVDGHNWARIK